MPDSDRKRVEKKILSSLGYQLKEEPHFGRNIKKLRGYDPEIWRYRIGDFRIFYIIDEKERVVKFLTIERRKDAYR